MSKKQAIESDWEFSADTGELTITKYTGQDRKVIVPEMYCGRPVKRIDDKVFARRADIYEIQLPSALTSIGDSAFFSCENLSDIKLPKNLKTISYQLFAGCMKLEKVHLPDSITHIGEKAFICCPNIREVHLPKYLEELGYDAFEGCKRLKELYLPENVKVYGFERMKNAHPRHLCIFLESLIVDTPHGILEYVYNAGGLEGLDTDSDEFYGLVRWYTRTGQKDKLARLQNLGLIA